jgi:hypothetical protein
MDQSDDWPRKGTRRHKEEIQYTPRILQREGTTKNTKYTKRNPRHGVFTADCADGDERGIGQMDLTKEYTTRTKAG